MSIENDIKRIADALETISVHLTNKPIQVTEPIADSVKSEAAPTRTRRTKAEVGPIADAVPSAPVEVVSAPAPAEKITEQMLREELRQFIVRHEAKGKNKGMEAATEILSLYGAKSVSTIKPEDYAAIVKYCREDKARYVAADKK